MDRLAAKVAIITGGASGIGRASALRFAAEGASVAVADIQDDAGATVAEEICRRGGNAFFHHADVGVLAEVEAVVAATLARFGRLDVMFNNAYATGGGYTHELSEEVWRESLRVMLDGVFFGMKAAIPPMLAQGGGSIVNTSSVNGLRGDVFIGPYTAAKAAVINLTRTVALEYARRGIRANSICPGGVRTPALQRAEGLMPGYLERCAAAHATGRLIEPEEIAAVALFLACDESSAVTGAAIVADAGLTIKTGAPALPPFGEG